MSDFNQLKELFETALSQPSGEREAFVRDACSHDPLLEADLASLLEAHDASSGFFERLAEGIIAPALSAIELDDPDDSNTGQNVSHYELLERIGGGGMGVVYKAQDTRLGRTVALKFLPRRHADNPSARARLLAEARAASALDHPNIGVVYEIAEADDGRPFIAMAWYDGETLKQKIRKSPLPAAEVVAIGAQLGSALAAAHKAGIIHRDVKPANVVVTSSGSVKLLDFGIAKLLSVDDSDAHLAAGTVAYMSPEQTRNLPLDPRTDIWSLGVLMYEILTGYRPFRRDSDDQVLAAIRGVEPAPLGSLRSDVPAPLAAVVERCLKKNADERYQSADQFLEALRDSQVVDKSTDSAAKSNTRAPEIERSFIRGYRGRVLAASAVIVVLGFGAWKFSGGSKPAEGKTIGSIAQPVSIVVLPFVDTTKADTTRYLRLGLADELRSEFSRIASVTAPGYLTARQYEGSAKPDSQIARETGARFLVTGTSGAGATKSQLNIQLVDGKTGKTLWNHDYDSSSSERIRLVRSVVRDVVSTAGIRLAATEREALTRNPTNNSRSYDLYLRARFAELSGMPKNVFNPLPIASAREAQALYAQAKNLDPNFGETRARLALSHIYSAGTYDTTRARMDQARVEAEIALSRDSSLSDAHDALSQYWGRYSDHQKSFEELEIALRRTPNDIGLLSALGSRMIGAGKWEDGVAHLERAKQLDPRNVSITWFLATFNGRMRRNDKAMAMFNQLIEINPNDYLARVIKGHCFLRWKGSADTLALEMTKVPTSWDQQGMATYGRYTALRVQHRFREGLAMLDRAPIEIAWDTQIYEPKSLMRADMYQGLGDSISARRNFEIARKLLADSATANPNNPGIHAALGLAYAGLGRKHEAIAEAERAMEIAPIARNSPLATAFMGLAIEIFAKVGQHDRALEMIELLLSMPSGREITVPFLRVWPGFDPLRGDPRLAQIIGRYTVKQ